MWYGGMYTTMRVSYIFYNTHWLSESRINKMILWRNKKYRRKEVKITTTKNLYSIEAINAFPLVPAKEFQMNKKKNCAHPPYGTHNTLCCILYRGLRIQKWIRMEMYKRILNANKHLYRPEKYDRNNGFLLQK